AVLLFDFFDAVPTVESAEGLFVELLGEEMSGGGAHEEFRGLQFGGEGAGGLRGGHAAVEEERGGVGLKVEGVFGNVNGGVGIAEKARGEGLDVHASLREPKGERKIISGIGFLEIGLGDGVADNFQ